MMNEYKYFVIFAEMRTGSNYLQASLDLFPNLTCYGELFNPHFVNKKDHVSLWDITLDEREANPFVLLQKMQEQTENLPGFRLFHDHDARIVSHVLNDKNCAKIILTRNPLERYVSFKIAQETGQWRLTNASKLKTSKIDFDADEFIKHLQDQQDFQIFLMHQLQITGQSAFYIDYEDLNNVDVLNGLAIFLGIDGKIEETDQKLKKQNPENLLDKLNNPEIVSDAIARLDRFNLAQTPNFEPRRSSMIPSFVGLEDIGLLYMPIDGKIEPEIEIWLKNIKNGALTDKFTHKILRQWKRNFACHRSFTILKHPLERAYDFYCEMIYENAGKDLYRLLTKAYQLDLPPQKIFSSFKAHYNGFLAFLGWLKIYLSGQTGRKIEPMLASQGAVLQGFAQFQGPDILIRRDHFADGAAWLAAELGFTAPILQRSVSPWPYALDEIYNDEIEQAISGAYFRDYTGYGFGRWKAV